MVISSIVDLTARKQAEDALVETARTLGEENERLVETVETDGLTALRTRQAFMDQLAIHLEVSVRHARPLSVLILDIDWFKDYNDDFGHLAGDEVLRKVGEVLMKVARRSDYVARLGGEEFGVILPETDKEGSIVLGERFREEIEAARWPNRKITVSIGGTTADFEKAVPRPPAPEIPVLLTQADQALYFSKADGRNRMTHASDMNP
jgi:diguanylate cyclase (GGDEF)-like protein